LTEGLLESGVEVVIFDIQDKIDKTVSEFKNKGFSIHGIKGDISDEQELGVMFSLAMKCLGKIDILVNCAGITRRHRADEFPLEDWDEIFKVNLRAVFMLCQMAGREMIRRGKGKIINIASMNSFFGGINNSAYASAKGGIALLTKGLASDWAKFGINVNAIAPGYMDTELNAPIIADEKRYEDICGRIPSGKWGKPDDLVGPLLFLVSESSDYVNGIILPVDGGYHVR
jgi:2-deoxy-D-gluconate 3-dehydrogenase